MSGFIEGTPFRWYARQWLIWRLRLEREWGVNRGGANTLAGTDAKGLAAAMVAAAERLAHRGECRIGLLFLVGEDNGSDSGRRGKGVTYAMLRTVAPMRGTNG